jgi:phosphonate transport system ATP-binding protein
MASNITPVLSSLERKTPVAQEESPVQTRPFLKLTGAGLCYGERWLFRRLNLSLYPGTLLAITGASGTGKSSLLACLGGALPFSEGVVDYCHSLEKHSPAWVFQDLRLVAQATPLVNVLMGRLKRYRWWRTFGAFSQADRREAFKLLEAFGLGDLALRLTRETSGGEQQRIALARALFSESPILLADEPVANLDEELCDRVLSRLRQEARERGCSVVCVLHHEDQVQQFADRALRVGQEYAPHGWLLEELSE